MTSTPFSSVPEIRYAVSDGASIAYQVVGDGPIDLVMIPGFGSHLERAWELPRLAHFYHRLSSFSRLILLDKRGTGLSDRVAPDALPGIEQRKDDLKAVMDEIGSERASLIGHSDGGPLALLFAAIYPDRVENLVLVNTYAKRVSSPDHADALSPEFYAGFAAQVAEHWGEPIAVDLLAPRADAEFHRWWAATLRASMSPAAARAMVAMNTAIDVREALPAIHVPTLVIHRTGDAATPVEGGQFIADHIDGARLLELPGEDHFPWLGDSEPLLDAIEEFVTGERSGSAASQVLASMLFTDIVSSTEKAAALGDREWTSLLKTHDGIVASEVARHGGREVKHTGDGSLSVFEGPARAARCWLSIARRVGEVGISLRGGLHTSEVEVVDGDLRGLGVHIAARLMGFASPGEMIVSSVVRDLSMGSGLEFVDRGRHEIKGVPGEWQLFGLTWSQ
jgi:pimeloyl-ACP methyl ester carboxylesterase/class 3 adenylate cyclase